MSTLAATLKGWAVRDAVTDPRARGGLGVGAFVLALALGAQVAVPLPFTPVPVTLQTLFVVLAGVVLGPRLGALSVASYVTVGALGAPVFSNGGAGLGWLLGPTGGYLLAAPAAALVAGTVAGRGVPVARSLTGLVLGVLTMYAGGIGWLAYLTGEPLGVAIGLGALPFLASDAAKVAVAFGIARATRRTTFQQL